MYSKSQKTIQKLLESSKRGVSYLAQETGYTVQKVHNHIFRNSDLPADDFNRYRNILLGKANKSNKEIVYSNILGIMSDFFSLGKTYRDFPEELSEDHLQILNAKLNLIINETTKLKEVLND